MNQVKGGGTKIPVSMPTRQPTKEELREAVKQSPEFSQLKREKLNKCVFPVDEIPADFHSWVLSALCSIPFAVLNMPLPVYFKLINTPPASWKFGELQKAVDIAWNMKPETKEMGIGTVSLNSYHSQMCAINRMRQTFEDIITPIQDEVLDELTLKLAPSIIK